MKSKDGTLVERSERAKCISFDDMDAREFGRIANAGTVAGWKKWMDGENA